MSVKKGKRIRKMAAAESNGYKSIANNKQAYHEYFVDDTLEVGIVLSGTEVKSLRQGKCNMKDCYAFVKDGEIYVCSMHISPYEQGNIFNKDPLRDRKLLLHKNEILKLSGLVQRKGMSLIPIKMYFKGSKVKLDLGICRGKKLYDKRQTEADQSAKREIERRLKQN